MGKSNPNRNEAILVICVTLIISILVVGAVNGTSQSYAAEGKMNIKPSCIMYGRSECDVDTFKYDGHVCVRWHLGRGSDMECWEDR